MGLRSWVIWFSGNLEGGDLDRNLKLVLISTTMSALATIGVAIVILLCR